MAGTTVTASAGSAPSADLPAPTAARLPRARWLDTRLLVGLLLVLGSVVGGARVVAAADDTVPVWALTRDLGAGTSLAAGDLVPRDVLLGEGAASYVSARAPAPVGQVLARPVGRGELLPTAAVADPTGVDLRRVTVEVERATGLARGGVVDVYHVLDPQPGRPAEPAQLVLERVTVAEVEEQGRVLGAAQRRGVVLLLRSADVRRLLDAAGAGRVELVQVPQVGSRP